MRNLVSISCFVCSYSTLYITIILTNANTLCIIVGVAEHKLFVGMLPKSVTEEDLTTAFSPFGVIKELTVIKGSQASKGKKQD